ncbi:class I SAM-dependent methyltransferase [Gracilibacillus kekensis]|uniref:Putative SAM-dependent methyltransferase n=1 Tax=Gracilibacillus kekensis TaxID=1027249 RepID=A0A1M7PLE7_9BACI|nr:class I SAM-dependent methyltransferase [Gracilibacillus kekensis]SHN18103.1 Putative SAM-dependent methyltransferase [Gracilibacillus kekensis]
MIITTASRKQFKLERDAKALANQYHLQYVVRNQRSLRKLKQEYKTDILVFSHDELYISPIDSDEKIFFHPNLSMIRAKRFIKGEREPFLEVTKLKQGMSFLDCTLGLAADSIIASIAVGNSGRVIGVEASKMISMIVKEGLMRFESSLDFFDQAMRNIEVHNEDHYHFLKNAATKSIDVIYFDPMFQQEIKESDGIAPLRMIAVNTDLTNKILSEARRVAKQRIVLKDHWQSERFRHYGFTRHIRKTAQFHYGTIELH